MDLSEEIKIGDYVICVKECDIPRFIGKKWYVKNIVKGLYYCENLDLYQGLDDDCYVFTKKEIVPWTPLLEELL